MPRYQGTPDFEHGTVERLGVLLVNLGTPDEPTPAAVRRYLAEFLWDPRVIELPRSIWWPILHGIILRTRPSRSAHAYQQVWTPDGSPLLFHSRRLASALGRELAGSLHGEVSVELAMTYGNPAIAERLAAMLAANVRRLIVLPLFPQYSATTTASVFDRVSAALRRWRWLPELRFITQYHDEPAYIDALATSVEEHWQSHGRKHLLMSFHGVPRRYLLAGDPYHCACQKTARLIAERLRLDGSEWSLGFQSRVGREEWLRPYTDELLHQYAHNGPKQITSICPGFATDCLETLEEIAIRNRADFLAHGGEAFDYVPALNARPAHVSLLANLVRRHAQGWPETASSAVFVDRAATLDRARAAGAAC